MTRDELEFSISQYHDGLLLPLERSAVEEMLARDPIARALLGEYQRLDAMLISDSSLAVPAMDWDAVHTRISSALSDVDAPVKTYRLPTWTRWTGAAAAVAALVAIVFPMMRSTDRDRSSRAPQIEVSVAGPRGAAGAPAGALAQISVGPSPDVAQSTFAYDDSVSYRPARVVIAASEDNGQDAAAAGASPYQ